MPFTRRTIAQWKSIGYINFLNLYENEQHQILLKYLERRIKSDFIRILASTGLVGDVYFTARVKKPFSAFDKLPLAIDKYLAQRQDKLQGPVLYQLIRDLVAIRLICIDGNSEADIVRRIVTSDTLEVDEKCEFYLQSGKIDNDYSKLSNILKPIFANGFSESKKSSGYESVQIEVRFFGALDKYEKSRNELGSIFNQRVEEINILRQKMTDETASHISLFPIEVQIRTFTQHIWARDEQKVIYSPAKSGQQSQMDARLTREIRKEFLKLQKVLSRAEDIRFRIQCIESRRVKHSLRFVGKSYEVDSRLCYFKLPEFNQYVDRLRLLEKKLSGLKLSPPNKVHDRFSDNVLEILRDIINLCEEIGRDQGENFLGEAKDRLSDDFWGRQRVILLMVGFLLLFSDDKTLKKVLDHSTTRTRLDSILGIGKNIDYGLVAASRLYEHILKSDRIVLLKDNLSFPYVFQDPLVYSRLASSRYSNEDYFGAATCMKELFETKWWDSFCQETKPQLDVPKRYQFHLRRAEYLWYHGYRMGDRNDEYETIVNEFKYCMNYGGAKDGKALSWIILVSTIMHGKDKAENELTQMAKTAEKLLENLEESERNKVSEKFYFIAALAVKQFHYRQFSEALVQMDSSRYILSHGISHPKGAIAIQLQMCDEIAAILRVAK